MATAVLQVVEEVGEELPEEFCRLNFLLKEETYDRRRVLLTQLRNTVHHAIASSLRVSVDGYGLFDNLFWDLQHKEQNERWELLQKDMPRLGIGWILPNADSVYQWFKLLANAELVGRIEWTSSETCRYHYYLYDGHTALVWRKTESSEDFDSQRPLGERNHRIIVEKRRVRRNFVRERHTHHLVEARISRLGEWRGIVPRRIARFLREVPPWLMPLLSITEGTIIQEDIRRDSLLDETVNEETRYVTKGSPAITLGPFTLVGWSSDDISWKDRLHRPFRGSRYKQ